MNLSLIQKSDDSENETGGIGVGIENVRCI